MMTAAKKETRWEPNPICAFGANGFVFSLAANSHQGLQLPTAILYPGIGQLNSSTTTGIAASAYDFHIRPRCTSKERDAETGLDYFGARYMASAQGRWSSPDRMNVTDDKVLVPSTLNKYAYAANNPLRFLDQDGRDVVALLEPPQGIMPGHFMLFANNPETGESGMMSFGPADTSALGHLATDLNFSVASTNTFAFPATADELRTGYAALSIQTTPEQAQDVLNYIKGVSATTAQPPIKYSAQTAPRYAATR